MSAERLSEYRSKMQKTVKVLSNELLTIRAGRANPALLDRVTVEYYGAQSPLNQVANIAVPEARMITIQPWDSKLLGEIERAILKSDLGITPNSDGKTIRLIFPALTEERRKDLTKEVKKYGENAKVAVRAIRRDAVDHFKGLQKNSEITEDDLKDIEKNIQKLTDEFIKEIDDHVEYKVQEIMEV